jgi:hypothetical protein
MIAPVEAVSESGPFLELYRVDDFADSCIRTSTKSKFLDAWAACLRNDAVDSSEAIFRHLACNLNCYSGIDRSYPIGRFTHDLFGRLPWRLLRAGGHDEPVSLRSVLATAVSLLNVSLYGFQLLGCFPEDVLTIWMASE